MRDVLLILGIRPDLIRASRVIHMLKERPEINFTLCWSGQHYADNLKDVFIRDLGLPEPDIELGASGNDDAEVVGSVISKLKPVLAERMPDVVVFLQASVDALMDRIRRRGREFERDMSREYIDTLNEAYNYFFFHYKETPLIVVNTNDIDFVESTADFEELAREIEEHDKGTAYYVPIGTRA